MKKLTVKEFSRYFSKYSGETVVVTRRGVEIGVWTPGPRADVDNEKNVEVRPVKPGEEIKCVKPEEKPVVQNSVVDQLRAQVSEIENRGKIQQVDSPAPIPEVWHKEELEEEEEIAPHNCQFLQHTFAVRQQPFRPTDHSLSFRCEALIALMTENDRHVEFSLQLLEGAGKAGLGYVAAFSRSTKVTFPLKGD